MGSRVRIVHVTDGAPRDPSLRPTLRGHAPSEAAAVRRSELAAALRAGGLDPDEVLAPSLGVPDHDAVAFAVHAAARMSGMLVRIAEMSSYHAARQGQGLEPASFVPCSESS